MATITAEKAKPEGEKPTQKPTFNPTAAIKAAFPVGKNQFLDIKDVGGGSFRINLREEQQTGIGGLTMKPIIISKFIDASAGEDGKPVIKIRNRQ